MSVYTSTEICLSETVTFADTLHNFGISLQRDLTATLQVNVGRLCDLACRHCHHEAGPGCNEVMNRETMDEVIAYVRRARFKVIDITGGAPELVPHIEYLIGNLAALAPKLCFRTNLTAMHDHGGNWLPQLLKKHHVVVVASLPSLNTGQAESQRGRGVLEKSFAMLKTLNVLGYGRERSGLTLDLVVNPAGAFLPANQGQQKMRFRQNLLRKQGIVFNDLLTLTNAPLGRFRQWLESSGNMRGYMEKLTASFNPAIIPGLMCRSQVAVSWDGYIYDCDFNLATGQWSGEERRHVSMMPGAPEPGTPIATGIHCYACTAGAGSSCAGAIAA
jgi:radical SAM/Cys-rich protein